MLVKSLDIRSFRGIGRLDLDFTPVRTTVFIGPNGAGKSSILDCLAIMLSNLLPGNKPRRPDGARRSDLSDALGFDELDISNDQDEMRCTISVSGNGELEEWCLSRKRGERRLVVQPDNLETTANRLRVAIQTNEDFAAPLCVLYPTNRAVLDVPLEGPHRFNDRLAAFHEALQTKGIDFHPFFEWFRQREDIENERRLDDAGHRDPQLEAVRQAISAVIEGYSGLRVRRVPERLVISKGNEELVVSQLSDGEKVFIAMVGDLARRMAIANPQLPNPLESEAVVMIDELELHLHPSWQRKIVSSLERAFPKCQFIGTTHSPQVLGHLRPESVWRLERIGSEVKIFRPGSTLGRESSRILEDVMEVPARPEEFKEKIDELFRLIDDDKLDEARRLRDELASGMGPSEPALSRAEVLIRRKEVLGR